MKGDWVKLYRFRRCILMFSKAPFYFSRGLPTLRWGSIAWGRYEFKVIRL